MRLENTSKPSTDWKDLLVGKTTPILRPQSSADIQSIVTIAARHKIQLSSATLDLSQMNRIISFADDLGIITIEPGVTFDQVNTILQDHPFMLDCGFSPHPHDPVIDTIIGLGDTCPAISLSALKAVLPNGQIYQSLLADGGGTEIDAIYKWGVGPYLDSLFTQGQNQFGIITQASIMLAPRPEQITPFSFYPKSDVTIDALTAALSNLRKTTGSLIPTLNITPHAEFRFVVTGTIHASRALTPHVITTIKQTLRMVAGGITFGTEAVPSPTARAKGQGPLHPLLQRFKRALDPDMIFPAKD